jgi:hypothetical protein
MVLLLFALFRAGFEPLSWRGDHEPSLGIKGRFGSQSTSRLKTGADWNGKGTKSWARRVFRPTHRDFRHAVSP